MLPNVDYADIHGQYKFNFQHGAISRDDSKRFLDWAFWRDFERNGPSLYRLCQTMLQGWQRYKDYPDPRVRERFARQVKKIIGAYNAALWAMEREFKKVNRERERQDSQAAPRSGEGVPGSRPTDGRIPGAGLVVVHAPGGTAAGAGQTYEPPTFIERSNWITAS